MKAKELAEKFAELDGACLRALSEVEPSAPDSDGDLATEAKTDIAKKIITEFCDESIDSVDRSGVSRCDLLSDLSGALKGISHLFLDIDSFSSFVQDITSAIDDLSKHAPTAVTQVFVHSLIRQINANIKIQTDAGVKFVKAISKPEDLLNGFSARFMGNLVSLGPASMVNQLVSEKGFNYHMQAAASAVIDTTMGVAIEIKSMQSYIKSVNNIDLSLRSPAFKNLYCAMYLPTFVRNFIEWEASSVEMPGESKLLSRVLIGFICGVVTSPIDTFANIVTMVGAREATTATGWLDSSSKAIRGAICEISADKTKFFMNSTKGALPRVLSAISGTIVFSKEGYDLIDGMMESAMDMFRGKKELQKQFLGHFLEELNTYADENKYKMSEKEIRDFSAFMQGKKEEFVKKFEDARDDLTKFTKEGSFKIRDASDPLIAGVALRPFSYTSPSTSFGMKLGGFYAPKPSASSVGVAKVAQVVLRALNVLRK